MGNDAIRDADLLAELEAARGSFGFEFQARTLAQRQEERDRIAALGREKRRPGPLGTWLRMMDKAGMRRDARSTIQGLGIGTIQDIAQTVETLSGGQRQAVAVARAAAFGSKVVILDEPTAALGVKESGLVLQLIRDLRSRGMPVILISHNMPHVFEVADRIHIQRLGRRVAVIKPDEYSMSEAVAIMTGATTAAGA